MVDYWSQPATYNTPANGSWFLDLQLTFRNESTPRSNPIYFLPTMGVDSAQTTDFATINQFFSPTIQALNKESATLAGIQVNIWELLNWVFVTQYWSLLYDVGQVNPTLYQKIGELPVTFILNEYTDTNNIFVNNTLFEIYGDYFKTTILPLLNVSFGDGSTIDFQPLNSTNHLEPANVVYDLAYWCTQTELKTPLSLVISLIVADYTFLNPALGFVVMFGAWYQRKRNPRDGNSVSFVN